MCQSLTQFYPIAFWGTHRYEEQTNSKPERNVKKMCKISIIYLKHSIADPVGFISSKTPPSAYPINGCLGK